MIAVAYLATIAALILTPGRAGALVLLAMIGGTILRESAARVFDAHSPVRILGTVLDSKEARGKRSTARVVHDGAGYAMVIGSLMWLGLGVWA